MPAASLDPSLAGVGKREAMLDRSLPPRRLLVDPAERRAAQQGARQRRYRERQRRDEQVYQVPAQAAVIEALLLAERVTEAESRDRAAVARELGAVLKEWAARWLEK
jgi:hypothetical protein